MKKNFLLSIVLVILFSDKTINAMYGTISALDNNSENEQTEAYSNGGNLSFQVQNRINTINSTFNTVALNLTNNQSYTAPQQPTDGQEDLSALNSDLSDFPIAQS